MAPHRFDRRTFLLGSAGGAASLALGCSSDHGGPYDDYFAALNAFLRVRGPGRPVLLIDLDRFDHNLDLLRSAVGPDKVYRIVVKSLPSVALLRYAMARTGTRHLMAFHQPFLNAIAADLPDAEVLLGNPLPAVAARTFYDRLATGTRFDPARQLQWLIDSPDRARAYLGVAQSLGVRMQIAPELDIGGHRAHVRTHDQLRGILEVVAAHPRHLALSGFMGYDAYAAGFPEGWRASLLRGSMEQYEAFVDVARGEFGALYRPDLTRNGAGSQTVGLYQSDHVLNDLAAGSAAVMPTHFDIDTLRAHRPAAFIATPVLKHRAGLDLPVLPIVGDLMRATNPNRENTWFIYGGNWKAEYTAPPGLTLNPIYGRSSNSEMLNGSDRIGLRVNDYVFLRPTQSEAVLLQFGDLWAVRKGTLEARWPVLGA